MEYTAKINVTGPATVPWKFEFAIRKASGTLRIAVAIASDLRRAADCPTIIKSPTTMEPMTKPARSKCGRTPIENIWPACFSSSKPTPTSNPIWPILGTKLQ